MALQACPMPIQSVFIIVRYTFECVKLCIKPLSAMGDIRHHIVVNFTHSGVKELIKL
jgi:hypothetical protein